MNNELYVIGNGFDLHHGMPSSYNDFGDYLKINDYYTYSNIEKYLGVHGKFWGEFEDGLSLLDADSIMDDCNMFLMSYGDDDWSDSGHHDYQYEISRIVESIVERMPFHFSNWVRQIPVPNSKDIGDSRLPLNKNAYFLNFNYTNTLQKSYGIEDSQILHIHGNASIDADNLVLGHGWEPSQRQLLSSVDNPEDEDVRVFEGYKILDDYFSSTFKRTDEIIEKNKVFLRV